MRRATVPHCAHHAVSYSFQSTLSMRRATRTARQQSVKPKFQSTLSMRRATYIAHNGIAYDYISIHALHEESDESRRIFHRATSLFQSTLSMRRATQ